MPIKKIVHGVKQLNNPEKLKAALDVKKHIEEIKKMGWKKFWKMNNRAFYLAFWIIGGIIGVEILLNCRYVDLIKTTMAWSKIYFVATLTIFTLITGSIINYYINIGIKQDYNTDIFMRTKMSKLKGIDWESAEAPFQKKKE